jgi:hypothetical protein
LNSQPLKTWLNESGRANAPDWLNCQPIETWKDETGRAKALDWLNSQPRKTWLDESGTAKAADWLDSQPLKTWLDESGRAKAADWLDSQPLKTWLAGFYMCWNVIGRFLQCFFRILGLMFFWPLRMTHRCSFDLWWWLIDLLLTFEHYWSRFCWLSVLMFFWPLTFDLWPCHKQTNIQTIFFHMTLPKVEGTKWQLTFLHCFSYLFKMNFEKVY